MPITGGVIDIYFLTIIARVCLCITIKLQPLQQQGVTRAYERPEVARYSYGGIMSKYKTSFSSMKTLLTDNSWENSS